MAKKKPQDYAPVRHIPGFKKGVESIPSHYLVLTPDFTIVSASDVFLANTMTMRGDIVGRNIFDVFPENPGAPQSRGVSDLRGSFFRVLETRHMDIISVMRYDIPKPRATSGFEERYWHPVNFPILDKQGNLSYIVHNSEDITRSIMQAKSRQPGHANCA